MDPQMLSAWRTNAIVLCVLSAASIAGCGSTNTGSDGGGDAAGDAGSWPGPAELAVCAPHNGPFSLVIDNPYLPLTVGAFREVGGLEAGVDPARYEATVLDETKEILGIATRVVMIRAFEGAGEEEQLVEVAREFYAQAPDGTVCVFGEEEDVYEDGVVIDSDGWEAGEDGLWAGIAMPGSVSVGLTFTRGIFPPDIETGEVTEVGVSVTTPAGTFDDTITILEEGPSIKKFARGIGEIFDDGLELLSYE